MTITKHLRPSFGGGGGSWCPPGPRAVLKRKEAKGLGMPTDHRTSTGPPSASWSWDLLYFENGRLGVPGDLRAGLNERTRSGGLNGPSCPATPETHQRMGVTQPPYASSEAAQRRGGGNGGGVQRGGGGGCASGFGGRC